MNQPNRENSLIRSQHNRSREGEISFTALLKNGVVEAAGEPFGSIDDVIVQVGRNDDAPVVAVVVKTANEAILIPSDRIVEMTANRVVLTSATPGAKPPALCNDMLSLKTDILSQRVIDVARGALVKVYDVRLGHRSEGFAAVALDVHRGRWFRFGSHAEHPARDWRNFLPLASISGLPIVQTSPSWIGRLKPAQIADLIEGATADEQDKLLEQVHSDPELEADVFQELEEDSQAQVFKSLSDNDVADVLSRMRADDAADAVMELSQDRRRRILELLPEAERNKVMTLLGYNQATAGGLMGTEFIALPEQTTVGEALKHIREATTDQPEALITIHSLAPDGKLVGTLGVVQALQTDPSLLLKDRVDRNVIAASPDDDISKVVTRMADFNLLSLPVVDSNGQLVGVVTVDDALEAALPTHWVTR